MCISCASATAHINVDAHALVFCSVHVEIAGKSELDFIQPHSSSTKWLAVSKPVMLMSEASEHSWIFRFKGKEGIYNARSLGGNCLWTRE